MGTQFVLPEQLLRNCKMLKLCTGVWFWASRIFVYQNIWNMPTWLNTFKPQPDTINRSFQEPITFSLWLFLIRLHLKACSHVTFAIDANNELSSNVLWCSHLTLHMHLIEMLRMDLNRFLTYVSHFCVKLHCCKWVSSGVSNTAAFFCYFLIANVVCLVLK